MINPRLEALQAAFDALTGFLNDQCPDDEHWEDFDPDIDHIRDLVIEEMEDEQ